mmetsp:Transcript_15112/g.32707  ORF Transcript_15112/g.32707 Transcript_15112/m.32707 type:complete len:116 (-) Transcript_15112:37-384(-)
MQLLTICYTHQPSLRGTGDGSVPIDRANRSTKLPLNVVTLHFQTSNARSLTIDVMVLQIHSVETPDDLSPELLSSILKHHYPNHDCEIASLECSFSPFATPISHHFAALEMAASP